MIKNNKGITLVALVVTIIVLLILAGITIATITNSNSVPGKAAQARDSHERATELNDIQVAVTSSIKETGYNTEVDIELLKNNLSGLVKDTSVISGDGPWTVESKSSGLSFYINEDLDVIDVPENTGNVIDMNVQIGDFVNYDAGTWTQEDIDKLGDLYCGENLPDSTTPYKFGGFKVGQSRNKCITPYSTFENVFSGGWRVLSFNNDGSVNLIHAGTPEAYYHPGATNTGYKSQYILSGIKNSSVSSDFFDDIIVRNWNMYENLNYSKPQSVHISSYEEITNIETSNNLRNINAYYWLPYANANTQLYRVRDIGATIFGDYRKSYGIRPVVTLKADCLFQNVNEGNTTTHNTPETAWNLVR